MTDQELKDLVASISVAQAKTDEQMKKTDEQMKKTDEQMKETDRKFKEMGIHLDGISKSRGEETEEFFLSSLQKNPYLGDIEFDIVSLQRKKKKDDKTYQMDIFLENGKSVGIVEVKTKAKIDHLKQLDKLVENFETFYTTHSGMKKYGVIAAKVMPEEVENLALKKGYFVLKQQGDHVEVSSPQMV